VAEKTQYRVLFGTRTSRTYDSLERAEATKRIERIWSGRVGRIQQRDPGAKAWGPLDPDNQEAM
jgi:hypothetical protein